MEKVLIVDANKCTGCRVCELVCSLANHGAINPGKSYIRVMKNKEMDLNTVALATKCTFCSECVEWCLPGALEFLDLAEAVVAWKGARVGRMPAPLFGSQ